jgi:3-hydroxyacyl-CoA dehydrogenase
MNVGVIGSGSIGPDLAYGFVTAIARGGGTVLLHDIRKEGARGGRRASGSTWRRRSRAEALSQKDADAIRQRLVPTLELDQLSRCDYVEAATENLETKRAILANVERVVSRTASSGSPPPGLPRAQIAAAPATPPAAS